MEGGAIIGEGAEGCVTAQPLWPCAAGRPREGEIPLGSDSSVVGKLVEKHDIEHVYLEAARSILGPQLSRIYLAGLQGMCSPANSQHPPSADRLGEYKQSADAIKKWEPKDAACAQVKSELLNKDGITDKYNLMFISRYPFTLDQWVENVSSKKVPVPFILKAVNAAIPPLLDILQRFYKHSEIELINMDLHHKNIFVRASGSKLQFGISDFGQCYFRRIKDDSMLGPYFTEYLKRFFLVSFPMHVRFRQVPFETRLIDFCFKKKMEQHDPAQLIQAFVNDKEVKVYQNSSNDIIAMNLDLYCSALMKKPHFIQSVELVQGICKKIRMLSNNQNIIFNDLTELVFLEFCMTRFMAVSPFVTIMEQMLFLSDGLYDQVK